MKEKVTATELLWVWTGFYWSVIYLEIIQFDISYPPICTHMCVSGCTKYKFFEEFCLCTKWMLPCCIFWEFYDTKHLGRSPLFSQTPISINLLIGNWDCSVRLFQKLNSVVGVYGIVFSGYWSIIFWDI